MRPNKVRERWEKGEVAVSAWLSIGNSYSAEMIGWSGADCVTVDLQHGMTDVQTMISMLQAISATPATPFVRVPDGNPALLMKALDAGAYGVICPMIDNAGQAHDFVEATRYPPNGSRSFGPSRGLLYGGSDYFEHADQTVVRLGMIETISGLEAVDEIVAVEGLDGIFIGPNDLGLSMNKGTSADPTDASVLAAIERCRQAARKHNKHIGIFCPSGTVAARWAAQGFNFVVPNSDANHLKATIAAEVRAAREAPHPESRPEPIAGR
ncbi:HpcH/HpaI aldolase/citrate lyase family protein [Enterobacter cloacae complex sp. 2024EL-00215]|uniref:HpcH/HpaI aldolase family protein n=1 Tax=unclassified Enterobacter cloacae complex TaxID=2757714 RepID=UPI003751B8A6